MPRGSSVYIILFYNYFILYLAETIWLQFKLCLLTLCQYINCYEL